MFTLKFIIKQINSDHCIGWIRLNDQILKGIVAVGSNDHDIIEQLELLFSAKLEFDYRRSMSNNPVGKIMSIEPKVNNIHSLERSYRLAACES